MRDKVTQAVLDSGLISPGQTVVCAVSGGADSMALLWALWSLKRELSLTVIAAHFNHRLRGDASDADEALVKQFCMTHRIPLRISSGDVALAAERTGDSLELAARRLRYAFLESLDCDRIATAHHADDNLETVLLNLVRGTGLRGLCGIPPERGRIIRPLLTCTKEDLTAYCEQHRLPTALDATNEGDDARRNRLRHQVIPALKKENPRLAQTALTMTTLLRQDEEDLRVQARAALDACHSKNGYSVPMLRSYPKSVLSRAMRLILKQYGVKNATSTHVEALVGLILSNDPSASVNLPEDLIAFREYDSLLFHQRGELRALLARELAIGMLDLPEAHLRVFVSPADVQLHTPEVFTVSPKGKLFVRSREVGDKLTLSGGTKSLKKRMIDRKIPKPARDLIPVLCDEEGLLGVWSFGEDKKRICPQGSLTVRFTPMEEEDAP
ncbi:MAG: tRNA lysidine(34) synthetase TilS [Clostridia bacterium]|nr:tRNA lysidine(34) synthetase TilS [Clostridia bacterium]